MVTGTVWFVCCSNLKRTKIRARKCQEERTGLERSNWEDTADFKRESTTKETRRERPKRPPLLEELLLKQRPPQHQPQRQNSRFIRIWCDISTHDQYGAGIHSDHIKELVYHVLFVKCYQYTFTNPPCACICDSLHPLWFSSISFKSVLSRIGHKHPI